MSEPLYDAFEDARKSGEILRSPSYVPASQSHGYRWRKAQGTPCARCREPIEGRRFEVAWVGDPWDSSEWMHVQCVEPATWWKWLGPPLGGMPRRRTDPGPGTATWLKKVKAASSAGTQIVLHPFLAERLAEGGQVVPEELVGTEMPNRRRRKH